MARGDITVFDAAEYNAWIGAHDLSSNTLKLGIVDDTITPTAADTTPTWGDYSTNEVTNAGNYVTGGITLTTVTFTLIAGVPTLKADDILIELDALGFTDGYWGILYDDDATSDEAILFVQLWDDTLGPASEQANDVSVEWDGGVVAEFPSNVLTWE
jgi:hypothetical protein